jgi:DNA gyrase/topoisomerase IV subunit A
VTNRAAADAARLEVLDAFAAVLADLPLLLEVVSTAADRADAARRLVQRFGVTPDGAEAVLSAQLYRLTVEQRERLMAERAERRGRL